jgi:predicted transcriptional regulator YdeE
VTNYIDEFGSKCRYAVANRRRIFSQRFPEDLMRSISVLHASLSVFVLTIAVLAQTGATKIVHQDEFSVVGIEVQTTGDNEMSGDGLIPGLWQKFAQEHILEKIPNKVDSTVYALYTNYGRGRMGQYTVVVGAKVKGQPKAPEGMVLKTIPTGQYAVLTSEKGPAPTVIPSAWEKIWALEDKDQLGGKRAYKTDFEVYDPKQTDPQNLQADLYVGLKAK